MAIKQVQVSDIFRRFADVLDLEKDRIEADAQVKRVLAATLDALGAFARQVQWELRRARWLNSLPVQDRRFSDEVRRFADMIDRRRDKVRQLDPEYSKMLSAIQAVGEFARHLGHDLGVGGFGIVVDKLSRTGAARRD